MQGKIIWITFVAAAIGALWDFITTFIGLCNIFGVRESNTWSGTIGSYFIAFVGCCLVLTFNLGTTKIWTVKSWYNLVLIVLWFAAIAFDFFTSLTGNYIFIAPAKLSDNITNFALWGFTLLITACPAIMVFFLPEAINSQE